MFNWLYDFIYWILNKSEPKLEPPRELSFIDVSPRGLFGLAQRQDWLQKSIMAASDDAMRTVADNIRNDIVKPKRKLPDKDCESCGAPGYGTCNYCGRHR